jgi:hypothetical protein
MEFLMPRWAAALILSFALLIQSNAFAQTTAPATQAAAVLDQTTPRGTLKLFFEAYAARDGDAMKPLLYAANPAEVHMVAAKCDSFNADRALTDALQAKFPDPSHGDPRAQALADLPQIYQVVDNSTQVITGDTATLQKPDAQAVPLTFKLVDGRWVMPLEVLVQETDPEHLEANAHQIDVQVKVMRAAIADVAAGKYTDLNTAAQDVKERMFNAAVADHAASTQAATQP